MDKELVSSEMVTHTKVNSSMVSYTAKVNSTGLMELSTRESSTAMRSQASVVTNGLMVPPMKVRSRMV